MVTRKPRTNWSPPGYKMFPVAGGFVEEFELYDNADGYKTKAEADRFAAEWRAYPKDARARVVKIKDRYYVYVN